MSTTLSTTWLPLGYHLATTWLPLGYHFHLATTWLPLCYCYIDIAYVVTCYFTWLLSWWSNNDHLIGKASRNFLCWRQLMLAMIMLCIMWWRVCLSCFSYTFNIVCVLPLFWLVVTYLPSVGFELRSSRFGLGAFKKSHHLGRQSSPSSQAIYADG